MSKFGEQGERACKIKIDKDYCNQVHGSNGILLCTLAFSGQNHIELFSLREERHCARDYVYSKSSCFDHMLPSCIQCFNQMVAASLYNANRPTPSFQQMLAMLLNQMPKWNRERVGYCNPRAKANSTHLAIPPRIQLPRDIRQILRSGGFHARVGDGAAHFLDPQVDGGSRRAIRI